MDLVATPKNPIPLGARPAISTCARACACAIASWQSALRERRGTVCIFPGRAEFIEKYFEVVGELRRRGFAVAVLDWRGQGGSSRLTRNPLKGHINDFAEYEEDLAHFMKAVVLPDCPAPYFALGHSMASMVLFRAATKRGCWFTPHGDDRADGEDRGAAAVAPRCAGSSPTGSRMFGFGKRRGAGRQGGISGRIRRSRAIRSPRDRERFMRNLSVLQAAPELAVGAPTIGWLKAALDAIERVGRARIRAAHPRAGADACRERRPDRVEQGGRGSSPIRLRAGSQIVLRGSRHEILQERDTIREQFWAAFDAFVPGRRQARAKPVA